MESEKSFSPLAKQYHDLLETLIASDLHSMARSKGYESVKEWRENNFKPAVSSLISKAGIEKNCKL